MLEPWYEHWFGRPSRGASFRAATGAPPKRTAVLTSGAPVPAASVFKLNSYRRVWQRTGYHSHREQPNRNILDANSLHPNYTNSNLVNWINIHGAQEWEGEFAKV